MWSSSGKVYALQGDVDGLAVNTPIWVGNAGAPILAPIEDSQEWEINPTLSGGLAVGGGMLIVPATGTLTAFGDTSVTNPPIPSLHTRLTRPTTAISQTIVLRPRSRQHRNGV